jgi:hypothetical protein
MFYETLKFLKNLRCYNPEDHILLSHHCDPIQRMIYDSWKWRDGGRRQINAESTTVLRWPTFLQKCTVRGKKVCFDISSYWQPFLVRLCQNFFVCTIWRIPAAFTKFFDRKWGQGIQSQRSGTWNSHVKMIQGLSSAHWPECSFRKFEYEPI